MLLNVGDRVKMRKPHPCGNDIWKITYVGADIKMCCEKCARTVMLDRPFIWFITDGFDGWTAPLFMGIYEQP